MSGESELDDALLKPNMAPKRVFSRNRCYFIGCGLITIVIIAMIVVIAVLAVRLRQAEECQEFPSCPVHSVGLLEYYKLQDGIDLHWFPHANTQEQLTQAIMGNYDIIETDILCTAALQYHEKNALTIDEFVSQIKHSRKGMLLNIDADYDPINALTIAERYKINAPVILSVPFPGDSGHHSNLSRFAAAFKRRQWHFPVIASVDLKKLCCSNPIGEGIAEFILETFKSFDFPLMIEIQAKQWRSSWREIGKILDRSKDYSLVVSSDGESGKEKLYDLLTVRNDIDRTKAFYKINGTTLSAFKDLTSTAGSPLLYFNIQPRDAGKIIWSHNTDTWGLLNNATHGPTMMVEADLRLKNNIPIMAHDAGDDDNLTFAQWIEEIIKVDKGMKLDFKELQAMGPALDIVKRRKPDIKGPIWVNADIVKGPYGGNVTMMPSIFFENVKAFPGVTLSVGWTTGARTPNTNLTYTMDMIREMLAICKNLPQPVTFPVRADLLRPSWDVFDWLLRQSRAFTLTVWTTPYDNVTKADMDFIQRQSEDARVYFDLPEKLRPSFE